MQNTLKIIAIAASVALSLNGLNEAYAKETGKKISKKKDVNPIVIKAGEKIVRLNDLKKMQSEDAQLRNAPFEMIFTLLRSGTLAEILIDDAVKKDKTLKSDPEVKKLQKKCMTQVKRDVYMKKQIEKRLKDSDVKKEYTKFASEYKKQKALDLKHILVPTKEEAAKLIGKIKKGEDFDKLAKKHSKDPNSKAGKSLGFLTKAELPPSFSEVAYRLKVGQVADVPVKSEFGFHVIKLMGKKAATPPTYKTIEKDIRNSLAQLRAQEILKDLVANNKVEIFEIDGTPANLQVKTK